MTGLRFKWCHFFRCSKKRVEETHCHEWDELVIFTEGKYDGKTGSERFRAGPGDVVLYRAGQEHWEANDPDHPPAFYVITFYGDARIDDFPLLMHDRHGRIRTICQWLNEQWWWETKYAPTYPLGLLDAILSELSHAVLSSASPLVESVRRFMMDHLDEPVTTAILARHAGMSRSHFCRRYRAEAHMAPMVELRRIRLFHARTLLQTSSLPTKSIARQIGLSGESALAHLFRKHLNLTPSAVRQGVGKTREELKLQYLRGEKEY